MSSLKKVNYYCCEPNYENNKNVKKLLKMFMAYCAYSLCMEDNLCCKKYMQDTYTMKKVNYYCCESYYENDKDVKNCKKYSWHIVPTAYVWKIACVGKHICQIHTEF